MVARRCDIACYAERATANNIMESFHYVLNWRAPIGCSNFIMPIKSDLSPICLFTAAGCFIGIVRSLLIFMHEPHLQLCILGCLVQRPTMLPFITIPPLLIDRPDYSPSLHLCFSIHHRYHGILQNTAAGAHARTD